MKYFSFALSIVLVFSSIGFAKEGFIFFYDFDNEQEGKPPSEPWKPTAAGKIEVVNFPGSGNKSVKIEDAGSGGGMTLILASPVKGKTVSMEFKFMRERMSGGGVEIFYVMNQKCPDDWSGVCVKTEEPGTFQYHNGGWQEAGKLEEKVWHDFKFVMHLDQNKYDLYYDGNELVKDAAFRKYEGIEGSGIDKFNVANVGDGGSTFVFYFDDIMLYDGTTKPVVTSVTPGLKLATMWSEIRK